ncbi:MAG: hypothetical protein U5R49_27340 [Deltaproteobacteria bacterium]|nr:hypothetical protein [Deltaproteobacteria bacterium]
MVNCHDMKNGDIYVCEDCGLELQVVHECKEAGTSVADCACHESADPCTFSCCGKPLIKK